jgi:type II secretory pathway pseudopilin PulG
MHTNPFNARALPAFSIVGMLITLVCMVVLFSILMQSLNKAVTGQGSQQAGTVRSFEDEMYLMAVSQSMHVHALDNKGVFLIPSELAASKDISQNTTANLFSAMVMAQYTIPRQLISGNEYSGYVEEMKEYNFEAYNPTARVYWDPRFQADLHKLSNVSFAHMPLCGQRLERYWRTTMSPTFPLLGNRGPQDGICRSNSLACGRDGVWRGHIVFGDGHIEFTDNPQLPGLRVNVNGESVPDNLFLMESEPQGNDAVFGFTKSMTKSGPQLQWD